MKITTYAEDQIRNLGAGEFVENLVEARAFRPSAPPPPVEDDGA